MRSKMSQAGFTLVELLIVVIILAILAAIVVPQFASSTSDAEDAALDTNLANIRAAIALYNQQHGAFPAAVDAAGATCGTGAASAAGATADTELAFVDQLTKFTLKDGGACTGTDGTLFGPYLDEIPPNGKIVTVANQTKVKILAAGVLDPATDGTTGWLYDTTTGQFLRND